MRRFLDCYAEPLVASDVNHDSDNSIFALNEVKMIDGTFVRVTSCTTTSGVFSCRMSDTAIAFATVKQPPFGALCLKKGPVR